MEGGDKQNQIAVDALHKVGMDSNTIFIIFHNFGTSEMLKQNILSREIKIALGTVLRILT